MAVGPGALTGSLVWDHAVMDVATITAPTASLNVLMRFIEYSPTLVVG
jgi:hypothetical protein